jgi:hypothetical protein
VEVAYPLREQSRQYEKEGEPTIHLRAIIPEPSFWDPQSPLLYDCHLDLWQARQHAGQVRMSCGLHTRSFTPRGLQWNGKPLVLACVEREQLIEEEALQLHAAGCNTLLMPLPAAGQSPYKTAEQFGFLVLGRISNRKGFAETTKVQDQTSALGSVLGAELLDDPYIRVMLDVPPQGVWLTGVELREPRALPGGIQFVVCEEQDLPALEVVKLPKLVRTRSPLGERHIETTAPGALLGYIHP